MGVIEAPRRKAGVQFQCDLDIDPLRFSSLVAGYDAANMTVDAEGAMGLASVWLV